MDDITRIKTCQVNIGMTLLDALRALDKGGIRLALVMDDSRLVGILSDGDLRRLILRGTSLSEGIAPHMNSRFVRLSPRDSRASALDLMQAKTIEAIPVVDDSGGIHGVHLLHHLLGSQVRPNRAVIMAGGRGSRLKPVTDVIPKPMIAVAGRPILERLVLHLAGFGIRQLYISINYLGEVIRAHFGDGAGLGCRIEYLQEEKPLGTGGPLSLLPEVPRDPLLVMNGDLITQANLGGMLDAHTQGGQKITIGTRPYFHTVPYGCVVKEGSKIKAFREKPSLEQDVSTGIYVLDQDLIVRIPKNQEFPITNLFEECLQRGEIIESYEIGDDWIDVGTSHQLRDAKEGKT